MLIAIIVLFALYITNKQRERTNTRIIPKKMKYNRVTSKNADSVESNNKANPERFQCPHHFGFLKTRKDKGFPEECAGCENLVGCMFPRE